MTIEEHEEKHPWSFSDKKDYERELANLVAQEMGDSEDYERLMEEYLRFCTVE
jgi:hypothetical protein